MPDLDNLASLIRAGHPVIIIDTAEETRVVEMEHWAERMPIEAVMAENGWPAGT